MAVVLKRIAVQPRLRLRLVEGHRPHSRPCVKRATWSRTSLMVGLLAFVTIQAFTNLAIRREWCPVRDPLYFDKLALFQSTAPEFFAATQDNEPVKVLFTGSSRTQNAVDTGTLQTLLTSQLGRPVSAFNFALAGCGPVTNAVYFRRLAKDGAKPDIVLIEVHPVFLAGQRPDPPETRWLLPIRLRPEELPTVAAMGFPSQPSSAVGWRGWLASWYEYRFILVDRYATGLRSMPKLNEGHEPDAHGFVRAREIREPERMVLSELTRRQYQDYFPAYRPSGPGVAALRDMLETCRANGWKAAIFVPPESAAFRGWYAESGSRELEALLESLSQEFAVPLINARTWVPDDRIGDGHHLCGSGADILTAKLAKDALAPWISTVKPRP